MLAIFLDIETTGLDFYQHRSIDIAFKIINVNSGKVLYTYQTVVSQPLDVWEKRDPMSAEFNGFTWEKVQTGKTEVEIKSEIIKIFAEIGIVRGKAVYVCQNPAFDKCFFSQIVEIYTQEELNWPYHWLDLASMYWCTRVKEAQQMHQPMPAEMNLSKNSIAEHYNLPKEVTPHSALNGVNHLIECYRAVFEQM